MSQPAITIEFEYGGAEAAERAMSELTRLWPHASKLDFESLGEIGRLALQFLDGSADPGLYLYVQGESSAGSACRMSVSVKPTQLFLDLLAALRAVEGEVDAVE